MQPDDDFRMVDRIALACVIEDAINSEHGTSVDAQSPGMLAAGLAQRLSAERAALLSALGHDDCVDRWGYDGLMARAKEWRERADRAEAERDRLREALDGHDGCVTRAEVLRSPDVGMVFAYQAGMDEARAEAGRLREAPRRIADNYDEDADDLDLGDHPSLGGFA